MLLLRGRLKSVADVLEVFGKEWCIGTGWDALYGRWNAVCRQSPVWLVRTLEPWVRWILPDLHGFYEWVINTLEGH